MHAGQCCELCGRCGVELTRHHLIPRMRHRNKQVQRRFSREEMTRQLLWVCRPCHSNVHTLLDERELANYFHTRERLLAHPGVARFGAWIHSKPPGFKPKGNSWKRD